MSLSHHPSIVKNGLVAYFDAANVKSYPSAQDSFVNNVSLLLDGESLTDKSQNNFTVTNSSAAISAAQVKYGNSSIYFNGSSFVSVPNSSAFSFGTGDFTIETWLKLGAAITATSGDASYRSIVNKYSAGSTGTEDAFYVYLNNAAGTMQLNVGFVSNTTASNFAFNITGVDTSLNSVWNHIAVVRSSGSLKVYFNGTQIGTTQTYASSINQGTLPLLVGARTYAPYDLYLNGYIDDLRITKSAIYTANFTPPAGPLKLPGQIIDLTNNKAIGTLTNGPTYSSGSIVFDGTNDYVKVPFNSNYNFGSGNFTVSAWINMTVLPSNNWSAFVTHGVSTSAQRWVFYYDTRSSQSSPGLRFTSVNASNAANIDISVGSTTGWSAGIWYYVTITRVGNVFTLYRNGIQVGNTVTDADAIVDVTSNGLYLGMENTGVDAPLNGKISLVQIYKAKGLTSTEVLQNYNATKSRYGY
jgi:hypothetical protein